MAQVSRYHSALVILHWASAVLLLLALGIGSQVLADLPNSSPEKPVALMGHMIAGGVILLLTIVRLVVRLNTAHPPAATTGMAWADKMAPMMHWALYALVLLMAGSGIAMSVAFDLPTVVLAGQGSLPPDFHAVAARSVHGLASKAMGALIALHIGAALYHQLMRRDRLLSRMGFGQRDAQ
jgi:cytochrome b561